MKYIKYLCAYTVPAAAGLAIYLGGYWTFFPLVFLFGAVPLLELLTKEDTQNMTAVQEDVSKADRWYDFILYGLVPAQFIILAYYFVRVSGADLFMYERVGMTIAAGLSCGLSINNAHELGHRQKGYEQFMSKLLLMTSLYMHFFIEHNRGHHKRVATHDDPATSRYGEHIYQFYLRTVVNSWRSAWGLERNRLQRAKQPVWGWRNEMLVYVAAQLGFMGLIFALFGPLALAHFVVSAIIGFLLLETVNYIEHYGLQRKKKAQGYERTLPIHSWNSDHPIGRLILLELSRHSDHHYMANRKYQVLRHFDESPQMPTGYPGTMLMALVPPLWFYVMHRRIDQYRQSTQGVNLA